MTPNFATSALYALDNLEVMRGMDSETIPLIYADPPFNSKRMYQGMSGTKARAHRFRDTWSWNDAKAEWLDQLENDHPDLRRLIDIAKAHSGGMGGYLAFMAPRIIEMRRILTPDGSLYIHCDTHANSYLRLLLDLVFGGNNFRNEIAWRRTHSKNAVQKSFGRNHDTLLCYAKSSAALFNKQDAYRPYRSDETPSGYTLDPKTGRYSAKSPVYAPGERFGDSGAPATFRGVVYHPPPDAHWRVPGGRLDNETTSAGWARLDAEGRMYLAKDGKYPMYIRYLDEMPGVPLDDMWSDISIPGVKEDTGWNTQKPLALLERIIKASSNEGDIVFDPFCGCGTALVAAESLNRRWVGADDDANAIDVVRERVASLKGIVADQPQFQTTVSVLHHPPVRTPADTDDGVLKDPTGVIIPKMPSDKMSNAAIRDQLLEWQGNTAGIILCPGCGELLKARHFHVDHINPKSAGGTNRIDNRILLCGACNTDKGNTKALPQLWNEQKIRGKKRQEMMAHVKEIQDKARALVWQLDAGAPAQPPMP